MVQAERPELAEDKARLVVEGAENKAQLEETEPLGVVGWWAWAWLGRCGVKSVGWGEVGTVVVVFFFGGGVRARQGRRRNVSPGGPKDAIFLCNWLEAAFIGACSGVS